MSLSAAQKRATAEEFEACFEQLGVSEADAARDLGVSEGRIRDIANLRYVRRFEDAWVLKRYLEQRATELGVPAPRFTVLAGDPEDYWFLDADRIRHMEVD